MTQKRKTVSAVIAAALGGICHVLTSPCILQMNWIIGFAKAAWQMQQISVTHDDDLEFTSAQDPLAADTLVDVNHVCPVCSLKSIPGNWEHICTVLVIAYIS